MTDPRPTPATEVERQLQPVRRALLEEAQAAAAQILAEARAESDQIVARAQAESDEAVGHARHRAALAAQQRNEEGLAAARREAHSSVLRTRAELRHELTAQVYAAAERLVTDPRYPALLDRLEELARAQLGQGALVTRDPRPGGGVVARAGSRQVDYRLRALADLALAAVADDDEILEGAGEGGPWR